MKRRKFITLLGSIVATWPLAVRAQQPTKLPIIGVLGDRTTVFMPWITAFAEGLHELGWIDDHTVKIEYRWAEGRPERIAEIANEFVSQKVDVIFSRIGHYFGLALTQAAWSSACRIGSLSATVVVARDVADWLPAKLVQLRFHWPDRHAL
jgi:putative ABC transport system substrate-binding protein